MHIYKNAKNILVKASILESLHLNEVEIGEDFFMLILNDIEKHNDGLFTVAIVDCLGDYEKDPDILYEKIVPLAHKRDELVVIAVLNSLANEKKPNTFRSCSIYTESEEVG